MAISRAVKSHPRPSISVSLLALCLGLSACSKSDDKPDHEDDHSDSGDGSGGKASGSGGGGNTDDDSGASGGSSGSTGTGGADAGGPDGGPVTVSGKASVANTQFVDSDTADTSITPVSNDDPASANPVSSPGLIGGYLGGTDSHDYYKVTLAAGDSASLYIASADDGSVPDFDLAILPLSGDLNQAIGISAGSEAIETVTSPQAGTFLVYVEAAQNPDNSYPAGRYTLSIGAAPTTNAARHAAANTLSPKFDFVPGQALVKLKPGINTTTQTWKTIRALPMNKSQNAIGNFKVALQKPAVPTKGILGTNSTTAATWTTWETITAIKQLRKQPGVLYAEPNYIRKIHAAAPNDPLYKYQWHYPQINLLQAWDHSQGDGTIVAVLDTGVKLTHPDFANSASSDQFAKKANGTSIDGYDFISDPEIGGDGDGRDGNPDDPGDLGLGGNESSWHGTHVSGTIAAATNNGAGCAGVAPGAKILPVRVLGVGGGTTDDIVQGILYAAGLDNDAGVKANKKADVINMSLGGKGLSRATADAIAAARQAGTIVVVSAGNDDVDAANYSPAGEEGVVTVGAIDYSKKRAPYSNFGNVVEVVAPGGDESQDVNNDGVPDGVMSLMLRGGKMGYTVYEGTSMAAPHISGIIALMKSVYPGLTPDIFDTMIKATGDKAIVQDLGTTGKDTQYGYGMLNANLAVLAAKDATSEPAPETPVLQVSETSLDFGSDETELPFDITNIGRGTLTVTNITATPGFTVTPSKVGTNTVTASRTGLTDGPHTGKLTIVTNGGNATINLRIMKGAPTVVGGDIGPLYVLFIPPGGTQAVAMATTSAAENYAWTATDVPAGQYVVVAGTDMDGNDIVNDEGEAFGGFPLVSDPQPVDIGETPTGIDFPVRFQFAVRSAAAGNGLHAGGVKYRRLR